MTSKCDGMIAPVVFLLGKHCSQPFLGSIHLQEEWSVKVREHQHRLSVSCSSEFSPPPAPLEVAELGPF